MSSILANVLPIFLLILIGWSMVRCGLLKAEVGDGLGDFVFKLAVPVLLFRTIATAEFSNQSPWLLWLAYFGGVAFTWTVGHLIATRLFHRDERIGVLAGVSSAFANNVFIGLPLVSRVVGEQGTVALSILLSVHLPVMMIAGTVLMERAEHKVSNHEALPVSAILRQVGLNLVRNPLVIGLALGVAYHLAGLPLDGVPRAVVDQIAGIAGPAALLSLGMALRKYGLADGLALASVTTACKLLLLPASVYVVCRLLGLGPEWTAAMVLTSSVPTGVNAWLIANHFGVGHGLASSTITLSTVFGLLSVSLWTAVLGI